MLFIMSSMLTFSRIILAHFVSDYLVSVFFDLVIWVYSVALMLAFLVYHLFSGVIIGTQPVLTTLIVAFSQGRSITDYIHFR